MIFRAKNPETFIHAVKQNSCSQLDGLLYPQFGRLTARMQSFSTWPASYNQNADDLSKGVFFVTDNVFYIQKPSH